MQPVLHTPLAALATKQHGHVHLHQLAALGIGRGSVRWRIEQGHLLPVHRGVYAVGHRPGGTFARCSAAVLACGADAVVAGRSAAALHGFLPFDAHAPVEILAVRQIAAQRGIRTRRTRRLPRHHVMRKAGIACTAPGRTILDLAHTETRDLVLRAAMEAEFRGLVDLRRLEAERLPGRGSAALDHLLDHVRAKTRSELEAAFLSLVAQAGLPRPEVDVPIARLRADFAWPDHRVVVETDGYETHRGRRAFERDRRRIALLWRAGWDVLPTTWNQVEHEPGLVAGALRAKLDRA